MNKPIIYQMLPRLWGNDKVRPKKNGTLSDNGTGKISDIDAKTLEYIKWLGCSHIWLTGMIRHSTQSSEEGCMASHPQFVKGKAGSPYAICDYYDINPYLADNPEDRIDEFKDLIKRVHEAGLKVIIDFVPNHVARDYGKISPAEGHPMLGREDDKSVHWKEENDFIYYPGCELQLPTACPKGMKPYHEMPAMATGNNCYSAEPGINDWFETVKINYCDFRTPTWDKMLDIVKYWASMGVDGFRCDMVELVPAEFMKWLIAEVKNEYPSVIFIAEVYKKELYNEYVRNVGFDFLYDKSGLYDTLRTIVEKNVDDNGMPVELWQSTMGITRSWQFLGDLQPYMLNFLENHDEQRFASDFFGKSAGNTFAPLHVSMLLNTAPFMIYFGEEVGEKGMDEEGFSGRDGRTTIFDYWCVDTIRRWRNGGKFDGKNLTAGEKKLQGFYSTLLNLCNKEKAIREGEFFDLTYANLEGIVFNEHKQYAFFRKAGKELLFIVVNFDEHPAAPAVKIPTHAFDYLGIPYKESYKAKDLLTGNTETLTMAPDQCTSILLEAHGAKILKIKL